MENSLIVEAIVYLLLGTMFVWLGILIHDQKNYNLIAGYNILTEELQKRVDIDKFSKHTKFSLLCSGILIAFVPVTLKIFGYYNWGISFLLIIGAGWLYAIASFILCFDWKWKEEHETVADKSL